MLYRHYPKADTLVIWQQYEGIYGETMVCSVLEGQTFFFSNWITDYNAQQLAMKWRKCAIN